MFLRISEANKEIDKLNSELAELRQKVEDQAGLIEKLEGGIADAEKQLEEARQSINESIAEREKLLDNVKAANALAEKAQSEQAEIPKKASAIAMQIAADQGIPPVKEETDTKEKTAVDIFSEYSSITNPRDRVAFYRQHKQQLVTLRQSKNAN